MKPLRVIAWAGVSRGRLTRGDATPRLSVFRRKSEALQLHDAAVKVEIRALPTRGQKP